MDLRNLFLGGDLLLPMLIGLAVLMTLDCMQTMTIATVYPWRERNPVLRWVMAQADENQSLARTLVVVYFILASVGVMAVWFQLSLHAPNQASTLWLLAIALVEGYCVINNRRGGIPFYTGRGF